MQINCQKSDLLCALSIVTRALSTRTPMPILEGVHMVAQDSTMTLTCTDSSTGIRTVMPCDVIRQGQVVLPGRLFLDMVRKLPEGEVDIKVNDKNAASLRAQGSRSTLSGYAGEEFPSLPEIVKDVRIALPQQMLRDMIGRTTFAIATDEARPILTGCLMEVDSHEIRLLSLDGFRLAMRRETLTEEMPTLNAVIPGRALIELARIIEDGDEASAEITMTKSHMLVELGDTVVITRLLEGEFIKYQQILPREWKTRVRLNRDALSQAVDRASLIARDGKTNLVRLTVEETQLIVNANAEVGDIHEEIPIFTEGDELRIAFNVKYLSDVLKVLDDEEVYLRFNNDVSPCVICPLEGDAYIYLVLPVRTI